MQEIAPGVVCLPLSIANVYFVGVPGEPWTLVDTGPPRNNDEIQEAAEMRSGARPPEAIVLTHGHWDHSGSARKLAEAWDVPIYAHRLELPFLDGRARHYPPADPTVGGFLALLSRVGAHYRVDLSDHLRELPPDGVLPTMPGWQWLPTPGRAPGHVSLFREEDRTLLAGDAVATVNLDSFLAVITRKQEISRPAAPTTCDWSAARDSAARLAELEPRVLACGHGVPMSGSQVKDRLREFAARFPVPTHGRYVAEPARTDENGIVSLPPPAPDPLPEIAAGVGAASLAAIALLIVARSRKP